MYSTDDGVAIAVGNEITRLDHGEATDLRSAIGTAASHRREFVRTAGEFRPDGTYAIERRGADSPGNAKVFPDFPAFERLYERLPRTFGAADLEPADVTGSRRHLVVWHFAEHPGFDCVIESRRPLAVRKVDRSPDASTTRPTD